LTKMIHRCKNETIRPVGSMQFDHPRGWGNVIFKEGKYYGKG
jgi:hypothetical protein